jgi:hypothetical protein
MGTGASAADERHISKAIRRAKKQQARHNPFPSDWQVLSPIELRRWYWRLVAFLDKLEGQVRITKWPVDQGIPRRSRRPGVVVTPPDFYDRTFLLAEDGRLEPEFDGAGEAMEALAASVLFN